ncbi:MAG: tetratricopeptide repeat protein [Pseudomonadota bacterium]
MKVVDIHPEELIDKLAEGSLTSSERERLDAHLAQCSSCRFEIAVRSDLAEDAPALVERPPLTFAGGARQRSVGGVPRELSAPRASRSVRARSRHRWPLVMLAAALVLCAGGAMAAVITGALSGHWLPWSREPKPAEPGARASDAKPTLGQKRAVGARDAALAPAIEASASDAAPVAAVAVPAASGAIALPTPAVVAIPSAPAPSAVRSRRTEAALAAPEHPGQASVGASPVGPAEAGSVDVPAAPVDAAALFADANRARRDGNVDRAVSLYRALQSRYPSSSESELSRALLAQLLLERGNPEAALAGFDRYLAEGTPILAAEALVGRARALEQLGKSTQAAAAWGQVQSRFPGSVHARLAAKRLAALGMR